MVWEKIGEAYSRLARTDHLSFFLRNLVLLDFALDELHRCLAAPICCLSFSRTPSVPLCYDTEHPPTTTTATFSQRRSP